MHKFSQNKQKKQAGKFQNLSCPESHKVVKPHGIDNVEEWEKQIWFWRSHLDIFIQEYFSTEEKPIQLFPFQEVIVRSAGNCTFIIDVESRSLGKTYKMALILIALSVLYPNNKILVVSKTVRQALLTIKYIDMLAGDNLNIAREIQYPIKIQKDAGVVKFKSGAEIEAIAMNPDGSNLRGLRKKIIYIDESAWIKSEVMQTVLMPILQYKRDIYWKYKDAGFQDFESKLFQTCSAYLKSCDFFIRFKEAMNRMKKKDSNYFVCALNYLTGVRYGIIDEIFVEAQKATMPITSWEMEWNSRFIGSTEGSYFPYDITEPCRVYENIELVQARKSKSRYILSCDIATSAATYADNACIMITKFSEKMDGTFNKYLVFIKSYHGKPLEFLANEIRSMCVRFPNIEKVIIDINALGEGIISLLNTPYVHDSKEYPPFVLDEYEKTSGSALPIIRGIKADNKFNNRMAVATRLFLENKSLHLPTNSNAMRGELQMNEKSTKSSALNTKSLLLEELAVYIESDALQFEMGNIIPRFTASGNIVYDTQSQTLHKDRYSTLGMAMEYIFLLEEKNKDLRNKDSDFCLGVNYTL